MDKDAALRIGQARSHWGFNPCFNGFMDKDLISRYRTNPGVSFNPCFNGFMDKDPLNHGYDPVPYKFQPLF